MPKKRKSKSSKKRYQSQERSYPFSSSYNPNLMRLLQSLNYGPRRGSDSFEPNINRNLERQGNYARLPSTRSRPRTDRDIERGMKRTAQTGKDVYEGSKAAYQGGKQAYRGGKKVYHSVKDRINRARGRDEGFRVSYSEGKGGMEFTETFRNRRDAENYKPQKGYTKTEIEDL